MAVAVGNVASGLTDNAENHRVAAGDVDYKFRVDGNSACIFLLSGIAMDSSNRVAFNVTDDASAELDRITAKKGWSRPDVFKRGFTLLRLYLDAVDAGEELHVVSGDKVKQIVVPD